MTLSGKGTNGSFVSSLRITTFGMRSTLRAGPNSRAPVFEKLLTTERLVPDPARADGVGFDAFARAWAAL